MNQSDLDLELEKIREEINIREQKIRSKLSYLLSRIQELESSVDSVKGDLFEREEEEN
jgi:hypothetical protein